MWCEIKATLWVPKNIIHTALNFEYNADENKGLWNKTEYDIYYVG